MSMDNEIGQKVRCFRKIIGLSQMELAEQVGVSYQRLQKYETGQNRLSVSRLKQICDVLKIPVHEFFSSQVSDNEIVAAYDIIQQKLSDEMNDNDRKFVVKIVSSLLEIKDKELRKSILEIVENLAVKQVA